jgi:2-oxoglutarate dehydrogenase E1 component
MEGVWTPYFGGPDIMVPEASTAVDEATLRAATEAITHVPDGFNAHPKVRAVLQARHDAVFSNKPFDWGTGEHLAFATLVMQGKRIRLSGQDARRGTFTHRHSVLFDTETGARYTPLNSLGSGNAFQVWDSPLSEAGVLGFEYGYSLDWPDGLVMWEAQFGDFTNGAQVIVDQFIVSAEEKWLRLSGLVLLLPHGYEGQGPEHSSARIERFLSMSAQDNIQVVNLTTPAQFFHVLRRQVLRPWRKPLVVFTPKSLLRHPMAKSTVADLTHGTFQRVILDADVPASQAKRVLLCSGKVYYELLERRQQTNRTDVAIVRLEQLYPLGDALKNALAQYADGTPLYWVQEEPRNMGAWYFLHSNLPAVIGTRLPLHGVSRPAAASPATGSHASHKLEQSRLLDEAFG